MNPLRLRPRTGSLLLGAALSTSALLALGAFGGPSQTAQRVVLDPHPALVVRVIEGQSYVVPAAQMLSVKSLGQAGEIGAGGIRVRLKINGRDVLAGQTDPNPVELSTPVVAGPGDVVTVSETFDDPLVAVVALGYLTDL